MINMNLYKRTCKVWTTCKFTEDADYGNYHFFKVGGNYVLMYKGITILKIMDEKIVHEAPTTKAQCKAVYTIKYMMGYAN